MRTLLISCGSMWMVLPFTDLICRVFYRFKVVFIEKAGDSPPAHRSLQRVITLAIDHDALAEV